VDVSLGEALETGLQPECVTGDIDSRLGRLEPTTANPSVPDTSIHDEGCYGTLLDREWRSKKNSESQSPSINNKSVPTAGIAISDETLVPCKMLCWCRLSWTDLWSPEMVGPTTRYHKVM
jgi:hypothetical protein